MSTRIRELRKELPARWLLDLGYTALSLLLVAGITGLIGIALHFYKIDHVTILYLIPVLVAALHWGLVPAVVAAMSSLVFPSSALAAEAAFAMLENAFITTGAPPRRFRKCAVSSVTVCGQSFMSVSPSYSESFYFADKGFP